MIFKQKGGYVMDSVFNYIFACLKSSDKDVRNINRALLAQNRLNNIFTILAVASMVRLTTLKNRVDKQSEEIKELTNKIKELEQKGE